MAHDAISNFEASDSGAKLDNLPGNVLANDGWELHGWEQGLAEHLHRPVGRIDSYSPVVHDDVILTGSRVGSGFHLERLSCSDQIGGGIGRHGGAVGVAVVIYSILSGAKDTNKRIWKCQYKGEYLESSD